ncbi:MAG: VWA domain-containing protein [Cyclobacteriaceae bacterium]|nr:VWA domain-containing protein [Cyclobacteriaceae bacterium]
MQIPDIILKNSPYYLIVFVVISIALSWLLYSKKTDTIEKKVKYTLAALRFLLLFLILSLFLIPLIQYLARETEKPIVVFAVDNSISVKTMTDSLKRSELETKINSMMVDLSEKEYSTYYQDLDQKASSEFPDSINYSERQTNLRKMLYDIQNNFEGRNINSVVLISDGIYNSGPSPNYYKYPFSVYSVGVGDSTAKKDIAIRQVNYNKISYQGNKFPIQVEVINEGFENSETTVSLYHKGKIIANKSVIFKKNRDLQIVDFMLEAKEKGTQRYIIRTRPLPEEFTNSNNERSAFIEIVEGKEKILLVAKRPHPDIKAITNALENNSNYSVELYIPALGNKIPDNGPYDLLILHQIYSNDPLLAKIPKLDLSKTANWTIYGSGLNVAGLLNQSQIQLKPVPGEYDQVTANVNTAFTPFSFSDEMVNELRNWPPMTVPFGEITMSINTEALLFQKIGSVETAKPLFTIRSEEPRSAFLLGEGLWRWRLANYQENENHNVFNELISKVVQYLSTKNDTKKLRLYPLESEQTDQSIVFETEVYNDLYERIYGIPVKLMVTDEEGEEKNFEYSTVEGNARFRLTGLKPGVYSYVGSINTAAGTEITRGQFVLYEQQIEFINLQADFNLLRKLSFENNGAFYHVSQINELHEYLEANTPPAILRSSETFDLLLNLKWAFLILVLLASTEWFFRKYFSL